MRRTPRGGSGTCHAHVAQAEILKLQKSGQFPDEPVSIKVSQLEFTMYLQDVLATAGINEMVLGGLLL